MYSNVYGNYKLSAGWSFLLHHHRSLSQFSVLMLRSLY